MDLTNPLDNFIMTDISTLTLGTVMEVFLGLDSSSLPRFVTESGFVDFDGDGSALFFSFAGRDFTSEETGLVGLTQGLRMKGDLNIFGSINAHAHTHKHARACTDTHTYTYMYAYTYTYTYTRARAHTHTHTHTHTQIGREH